MQFLVLVPYLRATGFRFRPRFDFRGSGLGHTLRLGLWTVLFVVVNQVAYTVVVRLASSGTVGGQADGAGYTVYANSFLLTMVPHSIITVSLATAMLPLLSRYAAEQDLRAIGRAVSSTIRSAYALIVPAAAFLALMARDLAHIVWGYGSAAADYANFAPSLALFGARAGAVHDALPGAARLLRHGAEPPGVLHPVRGRGDQRRGRRAAGTRRARVRGRTTARDRLRLLLRRRRGAVLHRAQPRGRRPRRSAPRALPGAARRSPWEPARRWRGPCARCLDSALPGTARWHAVLDLVVVGAVFSAVYIGLARVLRITEVSDVMALVGAPSSR